ncbi:hypothetical protein HYU08_00285 [Candidatus Woesearchaeota archaeon]|nr:hypothetical protein [Candidatus Woesearchaeota archaeon]
MTLTATERLHLRKTINELKSHKAPHTEFVTVYIPQGYEIFKIIQHLAEEQGTASNIKSASTRKNVQGALEKMIQHLRGFPKTPINGLAVFSGNIAAGEGKQDFRVWSVEPPVPLNVRIYRCDKNFVTDILEDIMVDHNVYGLVVLDRRDATLALLKGKSIVVLQKTHSEVPGKFKAGGQCCLPNTVVKTSKNKENIISNLDIGEKVVTYDFKKNKFSVSEIIDKWEVEKDLLYEITVDDTTVSCSEEHVFFVKIENEVKEIPAKELKIGDLVFKVDTKAQESIITNIQQKQGKVRLVDIAGENKNFIANGVIVHNSAQRFARLREGAYKEHFKKIADYMKDQFLPLGNNLKGIIVGGPGTTVNDFLQKEYITGDLQKKIIGTKDLSYTEEYGLQELLDKSEDLLAEEEIAREKKAVQEFFNEFRENPQKVTYGEAQTLKALEMNAVSVLLLSESMSEDKIFELEERAQKGGAIVKIISTETREGVGRQNL